MAIDKRQTRDLYRKRARRYDLTVLLFPLFGVNVRRMRRETVTSLALHPGDTVVEIGCGTGLNFPYVLEKIGHGGRLIGVDLTDAMLAQARERVEREGWQNVELVQADVAAWSFPKQLAGVYATLALTLVPEYDAVIERAAAALRPGGRLAVLDMKEPDRWPRWLVHLAAWLNRPFGVSLDLAERHPWESIRRRLDETLFKEYYAGALCLCVGEKRARTEGYL